MNKLAYLIIGIVAICLISSGAAIFLGSGAIDDVSEGAIATTNDNVNEKIAENINKDINEKIIDSISQENPTENTVAENKFIPGTFAFIPGVLNYDPLCPEDPGMYLLDRPVSKIHLSYGRDYTDRYGMCCDCQGYIKLGPITKALPEGTKYCEGYCDMEGSFAEWNTVTYNEIMGIRDESQNEEFHYSPAHNMPLMGSLDDDVIYTGNSTE